MVPIGDMPAGLHGSARTVSFRNERVVSGIAYSGAGTTAGRLVPAMPPAVSAAARALASAPVGTRVRRALPGESATGFGRDIASPLALAPTSRRPFD